MCQGGTEATSFFTMWNDYAQYSSGASIRSDNSSSSRERSSWHQGQQQQYENYDCDSYPEQYDDDFAYDVYDRRGRVGAEGYDRENDRYHYHQQQRQDQYQDEYYEHYYPDLGNYPPPRNDILHRPPLHPNPNSDAERKRGGEMHGHGKVADRDPDIDDVDDDDDDGQTWEEKEEYYGHDHGRYQQSHHYLEQQREREREALIDDVRSYGSGGSQDSRSISYQGSRSISYRGNDGVNRGQGQGQGMLQAQQLQQQQRRAWDQEEDNNSSGSLHSPSPSIDTGGSEEAISARRGSFDSHVNPNIDSHVNPNINTSEKNRTYQTAYTHSSTTSSCSRYRNRSELHGTGISDNDYDDNHDKDSGDGGMCRDKHWEKEEEECFDYDFDQVYDSNSSGRSYSKYDRNSSVNSMNSNDFASTYDNNNDRDEDNVSIISDISENTDSQPTEPSIVEVYRYKVIYPGGTFVRISPDLKAEKTSIILHCGDIFEASKSIVLDGVNYVKLADNSGWVFARHHDKEVLQLLDVMRVAQQPSLTPSTVHPTAAASNKATTPPRQLTTVVGPTGGTNSRGFDRFKAGTKINTTIQMKKNSRESRHVKVLNDYWKDMRNKAMELTSFNAFIKMSRSIKIPSTLKSDTGPASALKGLSKDTDERTNQICNLIKRITSVARNCSNLKVVEGLDIALWLLVHLGSNERTTHILTLAVDASNRVFDDLDLDQQSDVLSLVLEVSSSSRKFVVELAKLVHYGDGDIGNFIQRWMMLKITQVYFVLNPEHKVVDVSNERDVKINKSAHMNMEKNNLDACNDNITTTATTMKDFTVSSRDDTNIIKHPNDLPLPRGSTGTAVPSTSRFPTSVPQFIPLQSESPPTLPSKPLVFPVDTRSRSPSNNNTAIAAAGRDVSSSSVISNSSGLSNGSKLSIRSQRQQDKSSGFWSVLSKELGFL